MSKSFDLNQKRYELDSNIREMKDSNLLGCHLLKIDVIKDNKLLHV